MAHKQTVITVTHGNEAYETAVSLLLQPSTKPRDAMVRMARFMDAVSIGNRQAKITATVNTGDAVAATGTITLSSFIATDTLTVGAQVFTCMSSGATGTNEFNVGASDTATAANAVAVINAHPDLKSFILASSSGAIITITCLLTGQVGNSVALAASANATVSGAHLSGGADPTTTSATSTYHCGV